jgi:ribosome-associated protein
MTNALVKLAYDAIEEKKGQDVLVIDISEVSSIADYFIIASGTNARQVQAICDSVTETLGKNGFVHRSVEGFEHANWILLDYGDTIIHIFNQEDRRFYDLERIWKDGKLIEKADL